MPNVPWIGPQTPHQNLLDRALDLARKRSGRERTMRGGVQMTDLDTFDIIARYWELYTKPKQEKGSRKNGK